MTATRFRVYLALVLLAGGLFTCSDHRFPDITPGSVTSRLRVKSLTNELPNNLAKVSSFQYDAQGRLASIVTYQTPDSSLSDVEYNTYQYDGQNRLTQLLRRVVRFPRNSPSSPFESYTYSYNSDGRLTGLQHSPNGDFGFTLSFGYNSANKVASVGRLYGISGLRIQGSDVFTYTGNNLTAATFSRTITAMGGNPMTSTFSRTFTHDDKLNPFYGLYVIPAPFPSGFVNPRFSPNVMYTYFGGIDNFLTLSQNNPLNSYFNGDDTYQYQYNAANLPTVRTTVNNGITTETLRFAYESY